PFLRRDRRRHEPPVCRRGTHAGWSRAGGNGRDAAMNDPRDADGNALAERLARLTEETPSGSGRATSRFASEPPAEPVGPGVATIERIIRAFSELRRVDARADDGAIDADAADGGEAFAWGHLQVRE